MKWHFMVDIETLGTGVTSVIASIGVCEFDRHGPLLNDFYVNVAWESQLRWGFTVDELTLRWWMRQSEAARAALDCLPRLEIGEALTQLSDYLPRDQESFYLWAHGTHFDVAILEHAYDRLQLPKPWLYRNVRDDRAFQKLLPYGSFPSTVGTEHNALDDAKYQADIVAAYWRYYEEATGQDFTP